MSCHSRIVRDTLSQGRDLNHAKTFLLTTPACCDFSRSNHFVYVAVTHELFVTASQGRDLNPGSLDYKSSA